jgi:hypothetical protein
MRSILYLLSLSFFIACSVPSNPNDPQPIDPYQLSCEKAVERFTTLAKQADLSCQKDSDCIKLGSWGDCDCYIQVRPGSYPKKNKELTDLHNRIFDDRHTCQNEFVIFCAYDYTQGTKLSYPICKDGQCSVQRTSEQNICPGGSGEPWNP